MSFEIYVPCGCRSKNRMNVPPFIEKLELYLGQFEIKQEFGSDKKLLEDFIKWKFCEHDGIAIEYSMSQGVMGFRKILDEKYPGRFENFKAFIPECNHWYNDRYDKQKAIKEIIEFNELEGNKYEARTDRFLNLLRHAIEMEEEVYWT